MSISPVKEWSLKKLAEETGVPERTIRFYISRNLVPPPHRGGPGAAYGEEHKARILKIRELQKGRPEQGQPGLMLAEIELLLAAGLNPIDRFAAKSDIKPAASLPEPGIWRSYEVADDVRVMFKTGAGPWRTKLFLSALRWFAAAVKNSNAKEDQGE